MLYLSLALICIGLVIFVYSIVVDARERRTVRASPPEESAAKDRAAPTDGERVRPSAGAAESGHPKPSGPKEEQGAARKSAVQQQVSDEDDRPRAVLYEDASGAIDYRRGSGAIDPSAERYRRIRRIGSGKFVLGSGGITFLLGKKAYRYDFGRMTDLAAGDAHVAIFLKGSQSVKLFIFENAPNMPATVLNAYRIYREGEGAV